MELTFTDKSCFFVRTANVKKKKKKKIKNNFM